MNGTEWKWWYFVLAGVGIGGYTVWHMVETGSPAGGSGLLLGALCIAFGLWFRRGEGSLQAAARSQLERIKAAYGAPHERARVNLADFPHLDMGFYEETKAELGRAGFQLLGDTEDTTLASLYGGTMQRVCERKLVGERGTVLANVYHSKPRSMGIREQRIVAFATDLTDGSRICTGNGVPNRFPTPPEVDDARFPGLAATPLLEQHRERVRATLAQEPGVSPVVVRTLDDFFARERRSQERQGEYLRSVGWLTREFILAQAKPGQEGHAERLYREIQKIVAQEG